MYRNRKRRTAPRAVFDFSESARENKTQAVENQALPPFIDFRPDLSPPPFLENLPGGHQPLNRSCSRLSLGRTLAVRIPIKVHHARTTQPCKVVPQFG
jgi:hypothetical protein